VVCYEACADGQVKDPDTDVCSCRPGQGFDDTTDDSLLCQPCARSFFSSVYSATEPCESCDSVIQGGVTYTENGVSEDECVCPATFEEVTVDDVRTCLCPPGKLLDSDTNSCVACTDGYKADYGNDEACTSCGERKVSTETGQTSADSCACAPLFEEEDGDCVCPVGSGLNDESGNCEICEPGYVRAKSASAVVAASATGAAASSPVLARKVQQLLPAVAGRVQRVCPSFLAPT
jgi:hypothetical protein